MKRELKKIGIKGSEPKILLLGNGINRAFNKGSWDDLLNEINRTEFSDEQREAIKRMPYPLIPVICTENNVDDALDCISEKLVTESVEDNQAELYKKICLLGYDAILTTNYTYDIEKSINPSFAIKSKASCKYRYNTNADKVTENEKPLHKYFYLDEKYPTIWHIHGEAALPKTMILGAYGYVNTSSAIRHCANRTLRRYKGCVSHKTEFTPYNWVDYFLLGNVDIVGFGLDISEIDIWWLIEYKQRHKFPGKITIHDVEKPLEWKLLAKAYGIDHKTYTAYYGYENMYRNIIANLNGESVDSYPSNVYVLGKDNKWAKTDHPERYITESDLEMDRRAIAAVNAAIEKAKTCGKPIARIEKDTMRVYLEYPDGRREYVE